MGSPEQVPKAWSLQDWQEPKSSEPRTGGLE